MWVAVNCMYYVFTSAFLKQYLQTSVDFLLCSLSLHHVQVVDEGLLNIMSSCNSLRYLCLRFCHKLIDLSVSLAQLVDLEVYSCGGLRSISIQAEKLESLSYKG
jgi:hypothetical protein